MNTTALVTPAERCTHRSRVCEQLDADEMEIVDLMYEDAIQAMHMMGRGPFGGDSGAALRAAIARYVIECR